MACHRVFCLPPPAHRLCPHVACRYFLSVHQLWVSVALRQHSVSISKQLDARPIFDHPHRAKCQGGRLLPRNCEVVTSLSTFPSPHCRGRLLQVQVAGQVASDEDTDCREVENVLSGFGNVIDILEQRGLIESITGEGLRAACSRPETAPVKVYVGFDPTAESLHLGNLLGIVVLSWFQRCGHIPVAVVGGATGGVGDPSGKSSERPILEKDTIRRNCKGIQEIISRLLGGDECGKVPTPTRLRSHLVLNNYDWWKDISVLDFLRDVGKYARVGTMMAKDSVRKRLQSEEGMSFTEFTYQLIQGYDFLYLFREQGVSVQIGGSDQWGNITAGTDLIRKILQKEGAHGLTHPLLLKSDGSKFGKSVGGAVWLAPSLLSSYKFYQHLFATVDSDVIHFLKMLTFLSLEEIAQLEESMGRPDYVPNSAQRKLAEEVTRFVHGDKGLEEALNATTALAPGGPTRLDATALEAITRDVPCCSLEPKAVLGMPLVDVCAMSGLLPSKGAARRLIKQGGLYLNNAKVEDEGKTVEACDLVNAKLLLLGAGKKNKLLVRLSLPEGRNANSGV